MHKGLLMKESASREKLDRLLQTAKEYCRKSPNSRKLKAVIQFLTPKRFDFEKNNAGNYDAYYDPIKRKVYINKKMLNAVNKAYPLYVVLHEVAHGVLYSIDPKDRAGITVSDALRDKEASEGDYLYHGIDWAHICNSMRLKVPEVYIECPSCRTESYIGFKDLDRLKKKQKKTDCVKCGKALSIKDVYMLNVGNAFSEEYAKITNDMMKLNRFHNGRLIVEYGDQFVLINGKKTYAVDISMPNANELEIKYKKIKLQPP
jgi:predicted SprT family Zn-dependent metalloprotease